MSRLASYGVPAGVLVLMIWALPVEALSQEPDSLSIEAVVESVWSANPSLRAARLRADASAERVPVAGSLPDPMLSLGLMNRPVGDLGPDHPMTMNSVQLSQRFPWPGTRGFARERADRLARADGFVADETSASLVARAKQVYYDLAHLKRAIIVTESTRSLLRDFVEVATSRYAVGASPQQDILQAQVAVAEATAELTVLEEQRLSMSARLNALMGRADGDSIGALSLPRPGPPVPALETLADLAVDVRPALQAARLRVSAAGAGVRVAERQGYPDITVTVGYGQRPRFDDLATLMVGVSLPVWSGTKQEPLRREMETVRAMEEALEADLYVQTRTRLTELRAQAERARTLYGLYESSILPQAEAAVESALSAYRVGQVDYMNLLSNQMTLNRLRIELLRLAVGYHSAVAGIEAFTGSIPGEGS